MAFDKKLLDDSIASIGYTWDKKPLDGYENLIEKEWIVETAKEHLDEGSKGDAIGVSKFKKALKEKIVVEMGPVPWVVQQVDDIWSELELKCQPDLSDTLSEDTGSIDATVLPMTPHGPED